jgi:protein-disulfide isomerase
MSHTPRLLTAALFFSLAATGHAQDSVGATPQNPATPFIDTSSLKPPPGAKVAIVEYEDLECPACARAFPIVHEAAAHYHIPLLRYDFPLKMHVWSHDAAIIARYIQDKISPSGADEYRREVFASQSRIASKDDLQQFTAKFFADNHKQLPFVVDPTGQFAREVDAEEAMGEKANLKHTPTIVVVTAHHWIEVLDVMQLYAAIDQAEAIAAHDTAAPTAKHIVTKGSK